MSHICNAQNIITNYSVKNKTISNTIYQSYQDERGFIWFASEDGVFYFNGVEFQNYNIKNGLANNSAYGLVSHKNSMFALTYSGLQEIKNYEVNPNIDSFFANTIPGEYFHTFFQDSIIMLSNKKTAYVKNTKTNKAQFIKSKTILPLIKNNKLFYISHYTLFEQENKKTSSGPSICENNRKSFIIYDAEYGNFFTYSIDGTLKKYYTTKIKFNTAFSKSVDSLLYLSTNDGVIEIDPIKNTEKQLLKGVQVNSTFCDRDNNLWISTNDQGIYLIKHSNFDNFLIGKSINSIAISDDDFVYATDIFNNLYTKNTIEKNNNFIEKKIDGNIESPKVSTYENKVIIQGRGNMYINNSSNNTFLNSVISIYQLNVKNSNFINNDSFLLSTNRGLFLFPKKSKRYKLLFSDRNYKTLSIGSDIWICTQKGLFVLKKDNSFLRVNIYKNNNIQINDICRDINHNVWVSVNGLGIYKLDTNHKIIAQYTKENGLISENYICITSDNLGQVWAGSRQGLSVIKQNKKIINYTIENGLPSNTINAIAIKNDMAWLATDNGISNFNITFDQKKREIPIYFQKITTTDTSYFYPPKICKANERNIKVHFKCIEFEDPDNIIYRHRTIHKNDTSQWEQTRAETIDLSLYSAGEYQFELQAINKNNPTVSSKIISWQFTLKPFFYETILFYILILIVVTLIIAYITYLITLNSRKKKEAEIERQNIITKLTLDGLQNQMNPHFIFNAMSTIQNLILNSDERETLDFISELSKLMRTMFENARQENISLENEIKFLENYIQIEQIRYKNKFDVVWDINVSPYEIDDIQLPTMFIQPLIENAIKHGVSNLKDKKGLISISITIINSFLCIIVKDNGQKKEFKNYSSKKTSAISVINERLNLMQINNQTGTFDLQINEDGAISTLKIPIAI